MEFQKVINLRHSVRSFEPKKIPKKVLIKLVENATKAPSARNGQPWIFYIVDSANKRNKVSSVLKKTLISLNYQINKKPSKLQKITIDFYNNLGGAQNIIFIYRTKNKNEKPWIYSSDLQGISCAAENLMLSAVDLGLGTCWVGSFKEEKAEKELAKILGVKKNEELVASIIIGYPSKDFKVLKRTKKKLSEVMRFV
jgi:nitroreductase